MTSIAKSPANSPTQITKNIGTQQSFTPKNAGAPVLVAKKPTDEKAISELKAYSLPYNGGELKTKIQFFERATGLFGLYKESYVKCYIRSENGKDVVFETPVDRFPPSDDKIKAALKTAYKNGNLPSAIYKLPARVLADRKHSKAVKPSAPEKVNGFERNSLFSGVSITSGISNAFAGAGQWIADNNFLGQKQAGEWVAAKNPEFQKAQAAQGYNSKLATTQIGEGVGEALASGIVLTLGGEVVGAGAGASKIVQWGPKLVSTVASPIAQAGAKIGAKVVKPILAPVAKALKPVAKLLKKPVVQKIAAKTVKAAPKVALVGIKYGLPTADVVKLAFDVHAKDYKNIGRDIGFLPFTVVPMQHGSSPATTPALKSKSATISSKLPRKIIRVKPSIARRVPLKNPIVRAIAVAPVFAPTAQINATSKEVKLHPVKTPDRDGHRISDRHLSEEHRIHNGTHHINTDPPELPPHTGNSKVNDDNIFHSIPSSHIYDPFKNWKTMSAEDRIMTIVTFEGKTEFDHDFLRFFAQKDSLTLADMDMIVEARDYFGAFNRVEKLGNHFNLKQNSAYQKLNQTQQIAVEILELHSDEFALVNIRSAELHILLQDIIKIVKDPQLKKGECAIYAKDIFKVCRSRNMSAAEATLFLQTRLKAIVSLRQKFHITKNDLNIYIPKEQNLDTDIEKLWKHYNDIKSKLVALTPEWRMIHDKWGRAIGNIEADMHVIQVNMSPIARKEIGAKIAEIDRIVDADPILNTPKIVNDAKTEIFYDVRNGYSPEAAYKKFGFANLDWIVAQGFGITRFDLNLFTHEMSNLTLNGRSRLGKQLVENMPQIHKLLLKDGYYTGGALRDQKVIIFNYLRSSGCTIDTAFNYVLSHDYARIGKEVAKEINTQINLSISEKEILPHLIEKCAKYGDSLVLLAKKLIIEKYSKNTIRELMMIAVGGDNMEALSVYLRKNGY
jgi:hypothetical protein